VSEYLTFDQWKAKGYHVKKGSKHVKRGYNNAPLFSSEQVEPNVYDNGDGWTGSDGYEGSWEEIVSFGDTQDMGGPF
jgi:hypothetical protein